MHRHRRSGKIELPEMTGGGRGSEDAERRGRMPALVVVMKLDRTCKPDLDFDPDYVGGDDIFAGAAALLRQRQQHGNQRHRMMAAHHAAEIVEIERVGRRTVDQRRIKRAGAPRRAEDESGPGRRRDARGLEQDLRTGFRMPGQRHANRIDDAGPRLCDRLFGELTLIKSKHPLRQVLKQRDPGRIGIRCDGRFSHAGSPFQRVNPRPPRYARRSARMWHPTPGECRRDDCRRIGRRPCRRSRTGIHRPPIGADDLSGLEPQPRKRIH